MVKFIESELVLLKKEVDEMWTLVYNQLERAADAVVQAIFADFAPVTQVTLLLKKPQAPIRADFNWVGVELTRTRRDYEGSVAE